MPSDTAISNAVILSIGDELTLGQIVDTNAAWLSARLIELGILTRYRKTLPDDLAAIVEVMREASNAADLVLITGGIGPTQDDLTRQALADAAGVSLALHEPSVRQLEHFFKQLGRPMPETNKVQAMCPSGADMLDNICGTALGVRMKLNRAVLVAMPGVPHEMEVMFKRHVLPMLQGQRGRVILTKAVRTFGLGESVVGERLGKLMTRGRNPQVGTNVSSGIVSIRIRSEFPDIESAQRELDTAVREVERRLGPAVFGVDDATLQRAVGLLLKERGQTLATAESCTGGMIAGMLTDVPGSSAWFKGGWVVYANDMKQNELDVPAEILAHHGAVSEPVARLLAEAACRKTGADFALATTGVAGPDGGTPAKPVGTVWLALARRGGETTTELMRFPWDRASVRDRAAKSALNMLRLELLQTSA